MAEENNKHKKTGHNDNEAGKDLSAEQPLSKLLVEFGHLFLLFLRKLLLILWALLKLGLRQLLKYFCKAIILLWDLCIICWKKCKAFWYDNDTQTKVRLTKQWLKAALRSLGRWSVIALKQTWKGLIWLAIQILRGIVWIIKESVVAIIHLGPTLKKAGRMTAKALKILWAFTCRTAKAFALFCKRKQLAYKRFRKNKGYKGLLIDLGMWMKNALNDYLEESPDDETADNNGDTDDEENEEQYMTEENSKFDKDSMGKSKVHTFGRGLYNAMKKIVEDD